jgi:hypothetical protein
VVTTNVSIGVTSNNHFLYFQFAYFVIEEYWCCDNTPYLLIANNTCYDDCPNYYYDDTTNMLCQACPYDCLKCLANGTCTLCDNTIDHREMNTATGRCVPVEGYYESGVRVALPCSSNCMACTSSIFCTACYPTYYLIGTLQARTCVFQTQNSTSTPQPSQNILAMILILGALLLCPCPVAFCIWRYHKNKSNQIESKRQFKPKISHTKRRDLMRLQVSSISREYSL